MTYSIELRSLAALEIIEGYEWYESQIAGLGLEFLNDLERFNNVLVSNPFIHSYYNGTIRQGSLERFPYVVVYEIFQDVIVIYSVFMTKQDSQKKFRS